MRDLLNLGTEYFLSVKILIGFWATFLLSFFWDEKIAKVGYYIIITIYSILLLQHLNIWKSIYY